MVVRHCTKQRLSARLAIRRRHSRKCCRARAASRACRCHVWTYLRTWCCRQNNNADDVCRARVVCSFCSLLNSAHQPRQYSPRLAVPYRAKTTVRALRRARCNAAWRHQQAQRRCMTACCIVCSMRAIVRHVRTFRCHVWRLWVSRCTLACRDDNCIIVAWYLSWLVVRRQA